MTAKIYTRLAFIGVAICLIAVGYLFAFHIPALEARFLKSVEDAMKTNVLFIS